MEILPVFDGGIHRQHLALEGSVACPRRDTNTLRLRRISFLVCWVEFLGCAARLRFLLYGWPFSVVKLPLVNIMLRAQRVMMN